MLISLAAFIAAFGALLVLERLAHRLLQEVALLVSGHTDAAIFLYSIPLLPGVALHELSHVMMAKLLGVKVRKFSLRPERQKGGMVRLGAVEVLRSDNLRASLIGGAPLLVGMMVVGVIGWLVFNGAELTETLSRGNVSEIIAALGRTILTADALLWFYIIFAVANSMMPSASDVQAWPPVIGVLALVVAAVLLLGGTNLIEAIKPPIQYTLRWLATALSITAFVDLLFVIVLFIVARLAERISGRRIEHK